MKTTRRTHTLRQFLLGLAIVAGLAACAPLEPVVIYITPTPAQGITTQEITAIPTIAWTASATSDLPPTETPTESPFVMPSPAVAVGSLPTQAPVQPSDTAMPSATTAPATVSPGEPTSTFGAIIGTEYTLPPTNTPPATHTLPPSATFTPVNTPIATPYTTWPMLDGSQIGIQLDYNVPLDYWFTLTHITADKHVGWIKLQANWSALQPGGPDEYSGTFQQFTDYVQRAKGAGLKVLLSVVKAPGWARPLGDESGPPSDPEAYATFLRFMITQIKPENIDAIEVWNEPNLIREWRGALPFNGAGYMQLFGPAYNAIKQSAPHIQVISAGLAPTGNSDGSVDDRTYLQQMYNAGLDQYSDVVIGVHPYGWGNPPDFRCCNIIEGRGWDEDPHFFFLDNLNDYRNIMVANGDESAQMWVTEFGWATWTDYPVDYPTGDDWMTYTSPEEQAQYVIRAFEIGQSLDYVGNMFLWNLNFGGRDLIMNRSEMTAYSLIYDTGEGLEYRPLYGILDSIIIPPATPVAAQ